MVLPTSGYRAPRTYEPVPVQQVLGPAAAAASNLSRPAAAPLIPVRRMTYAFVALLLLILLAGVAFAGLIAWLSRSTNRHG